MGAIQKIDDKALNTAIKQWQDGEQDMNAAFKLAIEGDLSKLTVQQKMGAYVQRCVRMGIDPSIKPFDIIPQYKKDKNGNRVLDKETLYPNSTCAAELRKTHNVTLSHPSTEVIDNMVMVSISATMPDGRKDTDMGVIEFGKYMSRGDAVMKAITKAKRRVTFSILGMPEFNAEPGAPVSVDVEVADEPQGEVEVISDAQRKRLWAITTNSGKGEEFLRALLETYSISSTKDIPVFLYEEICGEIEAATPPGLE